MMMILVLFVPGSAVTNQEPPCGSGPGETSCASALDQPKSSGLFQSHASKSHMFVSEEKEYHGRREEVDPKAHDAHSGDGPRSDVLLSEKQEGRQALRDGNGLNADLEDPMEPPSLLQQSSSASSAGTLAHIQSLAEEVVSSGEKMNNVSLAALETIVVQMQKNHR